MAVEVHERFAHPFTFLFRETRRGEKDSVTACPCQRWGGLEVEDVVLEFQDAGLTRPDRALARVLGLDRVTCGARGVDDRPGEHVQLGGVAVDQQPTIQSRRRRSGLAVPESLSEGLQAREGVHVPLEHAPERADVVHRQAVRLGSEQNQRVVRVRVEEGENRGEAGVLGQGVSPCVWQSLAVDVFQSETGA